MTKPHRCHDCGLPDHQRPHQTIWDCQPALKRRIVDLEARVEALTDKLCEAQDTTTRIAEAWREDRARVAASPDTKDIISELAKAQVCPLTHRPRTTQEVFAVHDLVQFATLALDIVQREERARWADHGETVESPLDT